MFWSMETRRKKDEKTAKKPEKNPKNSKNQTQKRPQNQKTNSHHTSIVSICLFSNSAALPLSDGGSSSSTEADQNTSEPRGCASTSFAMCSTDSAVSRGSPPASPSPSPPPASAAPPALPCSFFLW